MAIVIEHVVQSYFERMAEIRSTGGATGETSFYSALENLLNEIGGSLDPKVVCNGQLRDQGAGHPDFGLYSKQQCSKGAPKPGQGEIPERGVIEVKPLADNSWRTAQGEQTTRYFGTYRLVLVTNYREFRLIGESDSGKPVERESFSLAADEATFWSMAAHPVKSARECGASLGEFLRRVMMNAAPLTRPEDIAWFLASYARDALVMLEEKEREALPPLRKTLETALGIKFEGEKGEHFFRSTLVQTLFYGIFSAWVIGAKDGNGKFDWKLASHTMTVPMISSLFEEVAKPRRLTSLGLTGILDRTGDALNRVNRSEFFKTFDSDDAVQHFYEPFLEAFDPELRKQMGVWYTPREIVRYMVERVDMALRTELDIADGLADRNVYVLDPCCGTGAYIVEVLRKIEETLRAKGEDALIGQDVKEAARERVFGFEIMSAPFVIAHWRVGNLLDGLDASVDASKGERPAIYLTNALTGWEPPTGEKATMPLFPEMEEERDQAENVKRDVPILVILGNPPYNAFAGTSPEDEAGLVDPYKEGLNTTWKIKKYNLDDLYVRFFRIAERRIEATGRGLICYISNYSYLSDPAFVVARQSLLKRFDRIWIDSLNGDSRETGKRTPTGDPDPSVFSTPYNRAGIKLGTAVGLFLKRSEPADETIVTYRDFWGGAKRQELFDSLSITPFDDQYKVANPQPWNRYSLRPLNISSNYRSWPKLTDLAGIAPYPGVAEDRGKALISVDKAPLETRMQIYFDNSKDWLAVEALETGLSKNVPRFDAKAARTTMLSAESYDSTRIVRFTMRPFDTQWAYYSPLRPLWREPRPNYWKSFEKSDWAVASRFKLDSKNEGPPLYLSRNLCDYHVMQPNASVFTSHYVAYDGDLLSCSVHENISDKALSYLSCIGNVGDQAHCIWMHCLAITYAPKYLGDNADGIAIDWPRIPLPNERALFDASVALGLRVEALLDSEVDAPGVTGGSIAEHLRVLGGVSATDLRVTVDWGRRTKQGQVFPGRGKTERRDWTEAEKDALRKGFATEGIAEARGFALLGGAVDIYLNDVTCWRGVPESVWNYVIGGYQVIKKWLSYREEAVLGRALTKDEAREVTAMVRRLTTLVLMTDKLNANYIACRDKTYSWPDS